MKPSIFAVALLLFSWNMNSAAEPQVPALMLVKANQMADVANKSLTQAQIGATTGNVEAVLGFAQQADTAANMARNYADSAAEWLLQNKDNASESDVYSSEGARNAAEYAAELSKKAAKLVNPARQTAQREAEAAAQREAEAAAQREAEAAAQREAEAAAQREAEAAAQREAEAAAQREVTVLDPVVQNQAGVNSTESGENAHTEIVSPPPNVVVQ